jgi:hypothetical protein
MSTLLVDCFTIIGVKAHPTPMPKLLAETAIEVAMLTSSSGNHATAS